MTNIEARIREFREMKRLEEEARNAADAIADELKAYMNETEQTSAIVGEYKISYTEAKRETLDKKRLEQDLGDLTEYTKVTHFKTFKVA